MISALVNFANQPFYWSQKKLNLSARAFGINKIVSWNYHDFKRTTFYKDNFEISSQEKGCGFWLWKPFIILEALKQLNEGDVVVYLDSGIKIINDIKPLIDLCSQKQDIILFNNFDYSNKIWTKRDCFVFMNCDQSRYWNGKHVDGAVALFKKSNLSITFLNEWIKFAKNINILTDLPNVSGLSNFQEFIDHRHDQSVLSLLSIKYNLEIYRCPTQFGNFYKLTENRIRREIIFKNHFIKTNQYSEHPYLNSNYGTLLDHHRTKKQPNMITKFYSRIKKW